MNPIQSFDDSVKQSGLMFVIVNQTIIHIRSFFDSLNPLVFTFVIHNQTIIHMTRSLVNLLVFAFSILNQTIRYLIDSVNWYYYHLLHIRQKKVTFDPLFVHEIDRALCGFFYGVGMSELSRVENNYLCKHYKPLDYKSYGMWNLEDLFLELGAQNKVLLLKKPETETHVVSVTLAKHLQNQHLKDVINELLKLHAGEIPFTCFGDFYKDKYGLEWNSFYFGFTDLDQLCHVLPLHVVVEVNSSGDKVMKAIPRDPSVQAAVIREIEEILERCPGGIAWSDLSFIEATYQLIHGKSLDYESFSVDNIEDLFMELCRRNKVLILDRTDEEDSYVMSIRLARLQYKDDIKSIVEKLLQVNGGEIRVGSLEDCYWDTFEVHMNPHDYGVYRLDEFCDILKDIGMVGVNSSGHKVMKAIAL